MDFSAVCSGTVGMMWSGQHSSRAVQPHLEPGRYPGLHPARLPDADGAAFPPDGRKPRCRAPLLGRLVSGDESDAPQITTAQDWHVGFEPGPGDNPADIPRRKPDYCLNLGITWAGMIALELKERVPDLSFKSFGAFVAGAAERAALVGDTGPSAPANWVGGFGTDADHVLLTLHAISPDALSAYSDRLAALFVGTGAFREIWRQDGMALMEMVDGKPVPTSKVHFGYTDGISQTTIRGGPERYPRDHQIACEPWLFVLSTTQKTILCRSLTNWALTAVSPCSRWPRRMSLASRISCSRTGTRSILSCWPRRCADGGATACR